MPTGQDLVNLFLSQEGDEYEWGAKPDPDDPDPDEGDCSGYVAWVINRLKVSPKFPHGSVNQLDHCRYYGLEISVQEAIDTPGALLFRVGVKGRGNHVAMSLGDGFTIEAAGEEYGVIRAGTGSNRKFNHGCLVPGVDYPGWEITE